MNKVWIVAAVDVGDSCDGKARILGAFKTEEDAKTYVRNDMEDTADYLANTGIQVDFDEMTIVKEDDDVVCQWTISDVEIDFELG